MRLLLDENLPVDFASEMADHEVSTVSGLGWQGVTNGELLRRASGRCDCLVTMDRSIASQSEISPHPFGVLVLRARSNRMRDLRRLAPAVLEALGDVRPGELKEIRVQEPLEG